VKKCPECGKSFHSLGYARHRSMHAERRAAQGERPANVNQQPQGEICSQYVAGGWCSVNSDKDWVCGGKPCVLRKRSPVR
jgi:hypothetical protein